MWVCSEATGQKSHRITKLLSTLRSSGLPSPPLVLTDEILCCDPQVHSAIALQTQSTHFPNCSYFKSWKKDSSFSILTLAPVSQLEPCNKSFLPCPCLCLLLCYGGCTPHTRHRGHPLPLCPTHTLELEPVPSWLLKD